MVAPRLVQELAAVVDLTRAHSTAEVLYGRVVEAARRGVPGCDGATFQLWQGDLPALQTATHPDLAEIDETQFQIREGPGLSALRSGGTAELPDTLRDQTWPAYSAIAVHHGVRSCIAITFDVPGGLALLQLYATAAGMLNRDLGPELALIVSHTRTAVRNVRLYTAAQAEAEQMRAARASGAVIEEAKGILMHAYGCDADAAFERLRVLSQREQIKLASVAQRLVTQVSAGAPVTDDRVRGPDVVHRITTRD